MSQHGNKAGACSRQVLIDRNAHSLRQALMLLDELDDATYVESPEGFAPHRVGAHLRHVIEFYECFFNGLESGRIDYDARERDPSVEFSRWAAAEKIRTVIRHLEGSPLRVRDLDVRVRMEDSYGGKIEEPFLASSAARELQVLSSHTTHHFALIAMTLRAHGVYVSRDLGMAPSTLRYRLEHESETAPCAR